jgi:tRNA uridine 5-carbamoylmethylation protein Kti12
MQVASDPPVLILTGPPGVGKTSAAAILAERADRAVHLEADAFFRFIHAGYVEPWKPESHDQNRLVMGIVAEAAAAYAGAGYFTIVDGIVIPRWFLDPLRERLRGAGLGVAYGVVRAPLPICEARLREREDFFDADAIVRLWEAFENLGELEGNAVDVTGLGPGEVADAIARALADGRLNV